MALRTQTAARRPSSTSATSTSLATGTSGYRPIWRTPRGHALAVGHFTVVHEWRLATPVKATQGRPIVRHSPRSSVCHLGCGDFWAARASHHPHGTGRRCRARIRIFASSEVCPSSLRAKVSLRVGLLTLTLRGRLLPPTTGQSASVPEKSKDERPDASNGSTLPLGLLLVDVAAPACQKPEPL